MILCQYDILCALLSFSLQSLCPEVAQQKVKLQFFLFIFCSALKRCMPKVCTGEYVSPAFATFVSKQSRGNPEFPTTH